MHELKRKKRGDQTHSLGDSNVSKLKLNLTFLHHELEKEEPEARKPARIAIVHPIPLPSWVLMEVILGRNSGCLQQRKLEFLL